MKKGLTWLAMLAALGFWAQSCSTDHVAGKSVVDESTNGMQAVVLKADGSPAGAAHVNLVPSWYVCIGM